MTYISVNVDVDVDLSDINTDYLIKELEDRHENFLSSVSDDILLKEIKKRHFDLSDVEFDSYTPKQILNHFKKCLGLREYHDK
jgi:hypothetical protein